MGGRGRGRNTNVWSREDKHKDTRTSNRQNDPLASADQKFREAQQKLQASVRKHIEGYESSSEEEEIESNNVIDSILKNFSQIGGDSLGRTQQFLEDAFVSGAATCLICIATVKRTDAIWSCLECYCFFHLSCIQRWGKDSIVHQKRAYENYPTGRVEPEFKWGCPKCRHEYEPNVIPKNYECFCGKVIDPPFHAWNVPHSCGETCGKKLKPICGHKCLLLCHPGPCPPCPKTIESFCYCNKSNRPQRCSNKHWSCGEICAKILSCKKHSCKEKCHFDECQPCPKQSMQRCQCGSEKKLRKCAEPEWHCSKVCNKKLSCGNHNCEHICHSGKCEVCPKTLPRLCPCGKTSYVLPCTQDTPTCGDTCGKLLECGIHTCQQRCHQDKCGSCLEVIIKKCRCGLHSKELPCQKEFLCETKCKQIRDCYKHPCNRKCCEGNCPPCEKSCGKTLSCGTHKCLSSCHRGLCYPCTSTVRIGCRCGGSVLNVPCGKQKKTKPPRCTKDCRVPPDCHHKKREKHYCHFGDCPPCRQICDKKLACDHFCPATCHSSVLVKIKDVQVASMPWEQKGPQVERKCLQCPDCLVKVPVTCFGKHETVDVACFQSRPMSCRKPCGRILNCQNHTCNLECHVVEDPKDEFKAGTNCENCEFMCTIPRPDGCPHPCIKPCHPGTCDSCKQMLRIKCHCGLNSQYVRCGDWIESNMKEELQSCGNQCPKNYECGHRCRKNCHSGDCPESVQCRKKVKIYCSCKRSKKEVSCDLVRNGTGKIECDEICESVKEENRKKIEIEMKLKKREEEMKNQKELEEFQKKFQSKKKYKERKLSADVEDKSMLKKYWFICPAVVIFLFSFYLINN